MCSLIKVTGGHVNLAVSISHEKFSNLKRIEKSSVKLIIGEGILNKLYSVSLVGLCWLCASFCETGWRCMFDV